jgi:hypothetical protein
LREQHLYTEATAAQEDSRQEWGVDASAFVNLIERLKTTLALSDRESASAVGIDPTALSSWLSGAGVIPVLQPKQVADVAAALDTLDSLFVKERIPVIVRRESELFAGQSALQWIVNGQLVEVAERYERQLQFTGA